MELVSDPSGYIFHMAGRLLGPARPDRRHPDFVNIRDPSYEVEPDSTLFADGQYFLRQWVSTRGIVALVLGIAPNVFARLPWHHQVLDPASVGPFLMHVYSYACSSASSFHSLCMADGSRAQPANRNVIHAYETTETLTPDQIGQMRDEYILPSTMKFSDKHRERRDAVRLR